MADPITIIGLISGIIAFVDFGLKVASATKDVRDSLHGTTAEVRELDMIIDDIQQSNTLVKEQQLSRGRLSPDETSILMMVVECKKLAGELRKAISALKRRDGARSKTLESARVVVQSFLKHDEIHALRSRLDILDERIRRNIENILQKERNSSIMVKLGEIEVSQKEMQIQEGAKLDLIRNEILSLVKQTQLKSAMRAMTQAAELTSLKTKLNILEREQSTCTLQIRVLKSLYFQEIRRRSLQIRDAGQRSNEWVYDHEKTAFVSWLESQKKEDGFFYITGRAGSGKSTLMKFIYENQRTIQSLEKWAAKAKLYRASYYFWNQGTEKQKSGIGLFQSLLYQILKSAPDLIPSVCQDRLDHEVWEMQDLTNVFKRLAQQTSLDTKFCFFIDGLDEYDGDEKDIIQLLREISISRHIKICASSRPGRQYESFLPKGNHRFDIARYTKEDMERFIDTQLQASTNWRNLAASDPTCQDIVNEISARAVGVWLWVSLVTTDIIKEVDKNEKVVTLRKIVNEFPDDLYEYFERIIKRIPKLHREEMAQTFLVTIAIPGKLDEARIVSLLDELDEVNSYHARGINNHWTHALEGPTTHGFDECYEGGQCNFLALAAQARLVKYVRAKVEADPSMMQKWGRPLLEYTLRLHRYTPISMPYYSVRGDPTVDVDMIKLLLKNGADPNEPVPLSGGSSVWALFLLSIHGTSTQSGASASSIYQSLNKAWYEACMALIEAGARRDCLSKPEIGGMSASLILNRVFGQDRAAKLDQEMDRLNKVEGKRSCVVR